MASDNSSCERFFTSIICCSCQTYRNASDHEGEPVPTIIRPKVGDHDMRHKSQPELSSKNVDEKGETTHVTFKTEANEGNTSRLAKSDTFSDYIHRAKTKIRAMSNIGTGRNASEATSEAQSCDDNKDTNSKDTFSDFINSVKMKIKRTASVGSRKGQSL